MSDVEITIRLPEELVKDAQQFDALTDQVIAGILRAEVDRRINEFVNAEIKAYREEKAAAERNDSDSTA
jgi:hypothetical protein